MAKYGPRPKPMEERFWAKVEKAEDENGCWEWTGNKNNMGYGMLQIKSPEPKQLAHRISWMMVHGEMPHGKHVLHTCDNTSCVRPDHLFLGSKQDNTHDMLSKGRGGFRSHSGPGNGAKKINWRVVCLMRRDIDYGKSIKDTADKFDVGERFIEQVMNYEIWTKDPLEEEAKNTNIMIWDKACEIRRLSFTTQRKDLAVKFGVTTQTINDIIGNRTWKDDEWCPPFGTSGSKLNWAKINAIRHMWAAGPRDKDLMSELQKQFGVGDQSIRKIVANKSWVNPDYTPIGSDIPQRGAKLNLEQVAAIRNSWEAGAKDKDEAVVLANRFDVTENTIHRIVKHKTWKEPSG